MKLAFDGTRPVTLASFLFKFRAYLTHAGTRIHKGCNRTHNEESHYYSHLNVALSYSRSLTHHNHPSPDKDYTAKRFVLVCFRFSEPQEKSGADPGLTFRAPGDCIDSCSVANKLIVGIIGDRPFTMNARERIISGIVGTCFGQRSLRYPTGIEPLSAPRIYLSKIMFLFYPGKRDSPLPLRGRSSE